MLYYPCDLHPSSYKGWIKVLTGLLSHDDGELDSFQLCGHEQGQLYELVQPVATVLCQSTAVLVPKMIFT